AAFKAHAQLLGVITRGEAGDQLNVTAVATAPVHVEEPGTATAGVAHQSIPEIHSCPQWIICKTPGQMPPTSSNATRATMTACNTNGSLVRCGGVGCGLCSCGGPHHTRVKASTYAISAKMEERMKTAASGQPICT